MSVECSTVVWKRNFGSASRKMVAVRLADHADDEGRGIWPSVERTAAQCGLSSRTVQRILAEFVTERILKVVSEGGRGPGSTTRYDFNLAVIKALPLAIPAHDAPHNMGDTLSPMARSKGDTDDAKGDTDGENGCHGVTQTVIEPSDLSNADAQARDGDDEGGHEAGRLGERAFKRAFAKWPTFVADSEPAARKAWDGLSIEERAQAIERQADYVQLVKTSGRAKFCSFAVYLAESRWTRVPERAAPQNRASAPAFGPAWAAICHEALLAGPVSLGLPEITRDTKRVAFEGMVRLRGLDKARDFFERQGLSVSSSGTLIFPDDFDDLAWHDHQIRNGYPAVNALYARADGGAGLAGGDAERGAALAAHMQFVVAVSALMADWQHFYRQKAWPFPKLGNRRGLYFPAGGPGEIQMFARALRDDHAA